MKSPQFLVGHCANCDSEEVNISSPLFCSSQCRDAAKLVRYVRAKRADGTYKRADIAEAIQMKLAMVLGGGYRERELTVSPEIRKSVLEEARGMCQQCGRRFNLKDPDAVPTIQHLHGDSNDLSNLKAFCRRCNMSDAQSRFRVVVPGSPQAEMAADLRRRWSSPEPIRLCDDHLTWNARWRELRSHSKHVLMLAEDIMESADDTDLPGFIGWTEQGTPIQDI
jgi:5-methylcytosine-specific restriction endonuclease McrA